MHGHSGSCSCHEDVFRLENSVGTQNVRVPRFSVGACGPALRGPIRRAQRGGKIAYLGIDNDAGKATFFFGSACSSLSPPEKNANRKQNTQTRPNIGISSDGPTVPRRIGLLMTARFGVDSRTEERKTNSAPRRCLHGGT